MTAREKCALCDDDAVGSVLIQKGPKLLHACDVHIHLVNVAARSGITAQIALRKKRIRGDEEDIVDLQRLKAFVKLSDL